MEAQWGSATWKQSALRDSTSGLATSLLIDTEDNTSLTLTDINTHSGLPYTLLLIDTDDRKVNKQCIIYIYIYT